MPSPTDDELLIAARDDKSALDRLMYRHYGRLQKVVQSRLPVWMERYVSTEDVVQETFARVFIHFREFESQGADSFFRWMKRIAENQVHNMVDFYRARKRFAGQADTQLEGISSQTAIAVLWKFSRGQQSPSEIAASSEKVRQLSAIIKELDPDHQEVIRLRYYEGHSAKSTAKLLRRTEGAVDALLFRAMLNLRRRFPKSKA